MEKKKAWIWFKGGQAGGEWVAGFVASSDKQEGVLIERADFVKCRVPKWRVSYEEPKDEKQGPKMPENSIWKYN